MKIILECGNWSPPDNPIQEWDDDDLWVMMMIMTMMTWEWWWWLWRWWPGSVPKAAISACPPMKDQHPYPRHPGHFHHYLHVFQANLLLYWISWQCNVIQSNGSMVQSLKSKAQVQGDRDSRCKFFHILSQKLLCLHKIANMRQTSKYGVEGHFGQYSHILLQQTLLVESEARWKQFVPIGQRRKRVTLIAGHLVATQRQF